MQYNSAMPLLDHFHPPLYSERHWEAFHARWAVAIADALNGSLPEEYFAETQTHAGSPVEVDVATFEQAASARSLAAMGGGGTAVLAAPVGLYSPPAPQLSIPGVFPDQIEVRVISREAGPTLVAAIELVSPGNKDRADLRRAFASKCSAYLQQGVGLMVVDIVSNRHANLHNELIDLLGVDEGLHLPIERLYAAAYHPVRGQTKLPSGVTATTGRIDVWHALLTIGGDLPVLPLPMDKDQFIPVDLEATYGEARQRSRLA